MLVVNFGGHTVQPGIHWRPVIFQADTPATRLAGLVGVADNGTACAVPRIVMGMVGLVVVIQRTGKFMHIVRLPDTGSQHRIGVPVGRIGVNCAAVITGLLTVTTTVNKDAAQGFIAARRRQAVVPATIR